MSATNFGRFKTARDHEAAGVETRQAEAIAATVRDAVTDGDATKADLKAAVAELKVGMLKLAFWIVVANTALTVGSL